MGEQADNILNGDDCQVCGEYIGPGKGFPRTCGGCSSGEDESEYSGKYSHRSARRRSYNKQIESEAAKVLKKWGKENGAAFKEIQPWHLSITRNGNRIDIYPQKKKFHHVTCNIRGHYQDLKDFLSQFEKK